MKETALMPMGNVIPVANQASEPLMMSSREIARLTEKLHKNVVRDIREMFLDLEITGLKFEFSYRDASGKSNIEYLLPKDLCITLVSGYNTRLRYRIINRWLELEEQQKVCSLPDFNDPAQAARAWANEVEQKLAAQHLLAELQPKAILGDLIASSKRTIIDFARRLPGVNIQMIQKSLSDQKYLFKRGTSSRWHVYAKYRHLFEERFVDNGLGWGQIVATKKGALKLAELYYRHQLPMRKNETPQPLSWEEYLSPLNQSAEPNGSRLQLAF